MITLKKEANHFVGASTDVKPRGNISISGKTEDIFSVVNGSTFLELDSGVKWIYDASTLAWVRQNFTGTVLKEYPIRYDLFSGAVATANPTVYTNDTSTFTLTNPTKSGFAFEGWSGTGITGLSTSVSIAKGSTGAKSYLATYTPMYAIVYNFDGGVGPVSANPVTYSKLTNAITLGVPTKEADEEFTYTFAGWTGTDLEEATETVVIAKGSTGNRSYTATWTEAAVE